MGRYVVELLGGLGRVAPEIEILPFYSWLRGGRPAPTAGAGPSARRGEQAPPVRSARPAVWLRRAAQQIYDVALEATGSLRGYNLYHEPNHIPVPWHGATLATVHDLSVLRHPEWHPADRVDWYAREFEAGLARPRHFITVSQFTRDEMVSLLGIPADRITPIPLGVGDAFLPLPADHVDAWRRAERLPDSFLLFVGTLEPRKNVPGLLGAYASLPPRMRERYPLLLAGIPGWGRENLLDLVRGHNIAGQIRPLGYVRDEDLPLLYNAAHALVWPTLYEGFGLPPLEALACGTPVITSNTSSLPEVVGDAAIQVDPLSSGQLAEAIRRIIEDDPLRAKLAAGGPARAAQFSWDACARSHAMIYRRFADD